MSLLRSHNSPVGDGSQHLCISMHRFDDRRTDEDGMIIIPRIRRLFQLGDIQVCFERIYLAPKRVPLDLYIHESQQRLVAADIFGKEDRASAGAPDRVTLPK